MLTKQLAEVAHQHDVAAEEADLGAVCSRGCLGHVQHEGQRKDHGPDGGPDRDEAVGEAVRDIHAEPVELRDDDNDHEGDDAANVAQAPAEAAHSAHGLLGRNLEQHGVIAHTCNLARDRAEGDRDRADPEERGLREHEEQCELQQCEHRSAADHPALLVAACVGLLAEHGGEHEHENAGDEGDPAIVRREVGEPAAILGGSVGVARADERAVGVLRRDAVGQKAVGHQIERHPHKGQNHRVEGLRRPVPECP